MYLLELVAALPAVLLKALRLSLLEIVGLHQLGALAEPESHINK